MRTLGVYLMFAAVALRTAVVTAGTPEFPAIMGLLSAYGLLLSGETWLKRRGPGLPQSVPVQMAYLFLQAILVIGALILSSYEDFLAMLFIPLSLEAVTTFGRQVGYRLIMVFSAAMVGTLLFSNVGPLFGLVMGLLYTGVCFLFGGYASQVQKVSAARAQNERMFAELQTAHRQMQAHADQVAALAVEHERNRMARELHDSVTQTVFSMNLAVQTAQLLLDKQPLRVAGQLIRLEELAASALHEVQSLIAQLRPHTGVEDGLSSALGRLAHEHRVRSGLQVSLELQGQEELPETVAANLYSIAHEALTNVARHSGCSEAALRLHLDKEHSYLEIEDHGRGFDPDAAVDQRGHLGLTGMFERAGEIGWQVSLISRPGQGTRIRVISNTSGARE